MKSSGILGRDDEKYPGDSLNPDYIWDAVSFRMPHPVYVYKRLDVPVKCKVAPIGLKELAIEPLPSNATPKEILRALYSDQVLMKGELRLWRRN